MLNFNKKQFRVISNSNVKDVGSNTIFSFCQRDDVVYGSYRGGAVKHGSFIARIQGNGSMEKRFHHLNEKGLFITGRSISITEHLPDGRLRLKESWEYTPEINGSAIFEEIKKEDKTGNKKHFSWAEYLRSENKNFSIFNSLLIK